MYIVIVKIGKGNLKNFFFVRKFGDYLIFEFNIK